MHVLCSSYFRNEPRPDDGGGMGKGHFGASRGGGVRKHKGVDVVCKGDDDVYLPFPAKIVKERYPYSLNKKKLAPCSNGSEKLER